MRKYVIFMLALMLAFSTPTMAKIKTATKIIAAYAVYKLVTKNKEEDNKATSQKGFEEKNQSETEPYDKSQMEDDEVEDCDDDDIDDCEE